MIWEISMKYVISDEVVQEVYRVLASRPYGQVTEVIDKLKASLEPYEEQATSPTEEEA